MYLCLYMLLFMGQKLTVYTVSEIFLKWLYYVSDQENEFAFFMCSF